LPDRKLWFAIPGDLESRTGGYLYDKRLIAALRGIGWSIEHLALPGSFPFPGVDDLGQAAADLAACPDGAIVLIDGLAFGAMPDIAAREAKRLRLAALVHHPLALESGLSNLDRVRFAALETRALGLARAVIVTSQTTAATLIRDYAVAANGITVAKPGFDRPRPKPAADRSPGPIRLLSVGSVIPRKGFDVLVEALARIADLTWTCTIAGSLERSSGAVCDLRRRIAAHGLDERIVLAGEQEDLTPLYERADIFVLPSRYEGYGMVYAEAMLHGLPIIGTEIGAIPEVVPPTACILVPVEDAEALAEALRRMILDAALRSRLASGARIAAADLPSWRECANLVASAFSQMQG
jgi:glycosyltransferase involved in cell wall biosynthesis